MIITTPAPNCTIIVTITLECSCCSLRESFEKNVDQWREFYNAKEPHKTPLPEPWHSSLSEFQRMMVLRCIRQDKVRVVCIGQFSEAGLHE